MKIAVDAMGGDHAPREVVRGAVESARSNGLSLILVGQEERVRAELRAVDTSGADIEVVHASEVVEMCDVPGIVLRKKRDSSIRVGLQLVADGKASSFISAGNSGAVMAGGLLILKKIHGVDRPAIAATIPTPHGPVVLIDAGANVDCKPAHLLQFGYMGEVYARMILGISRPRVGVVSIGEEDSKGTDLTRDTCDLFRRTGLNFVGNAEGRDFFAGKADVFVCDGFVGNVAIKTMEGMATAIGQFLKEEINKSALAKVGALLAERALRGVKDRLDYEEYGGAPLLGVRGGVFICHGSSSERAMKNGIRAAGSLARCAVDMEIARSIEARGHAAPNAAARR
ncbi:MAG: phosphate acyltransferase [Deltaproteobacteria bacterium RBG_16_66_15]|nr:MAG: phosphate acyltransferase [Deltaproteobacteria bacterium GWA2_65_63]OGP29084.1 MAG: phosphate acyltransferase [Deltaproteobacteria bacterium GWB2_65_81]OGP38272.1 MAG: phosphate acyltransferase [Deltaproteobacteria bacterium GWC2_66_88]OGP79651.1 MAG: phosphate acyltransferase [Deltaproteobacteria bacterium RBG_16_66_15]HAM32016.1 phosphate acyltransferase PlsX [Deltaproteobacteria bacterium]